MDVLAKSTGKNVELPFHNMGTSRRNHQYRIYSNFCREVNISGNLM